MEASKEQILFHGYGLKLISDTRIRTGRICKTDKGYRELKKLNCDTQRAEFIHSAKEHAYKNGFFNIRRFYTTEENLPYYKTEDGLYVLEDYFPLDYLDMEEEQNVLKCAVQIAKFHNAAEGLDYEGGFSNYGKSVEQFGKRKKELRHIKKWIDRQSKKSEVDMLVISNMKYYLEKAEQAQYLTSKAVYDEILEHAKSKKTICHNNFKSETILQKDDGKLIITSFEKAAYDCTVNDLAEFMQRYMRQDYANVSTVYKIVETYNSIRSISDKELQVLYGLLVFPKKFFKLCNQYYNKRRTYVSDAILKKNGGVRGR